MNFSFRSMGYLVVFLAGLLTGMLLTTRLAGDTGRDREVEAAARSLAPPPRQTRVELADNGTRESDEFDLAAGPAVISVEYNGHDWFWFGLSDVTSSVTASAASLGFVGSNFGPWKTRISVRVSKAGRYRLEIRTEGEWKAAVAQ